MKNEVQGGHQVLIVGSGGFAMSHAAVLKAHGWTPLISPVRPERIPQLESEGWKTVESIRHAQDLGVTQAIVATNNSRHVKDAQECVWCGMRTLVEKPLAISV